MQEIAITNKQILIKSLLIKLFIMKKLFIKLMSVTIVLAISASSFGQSGKIRPGVASDFESNFLESQNQIVKPNSTLKNASFLSSMQAGADRLTNMQHTDGSWGWPLIAPPSYANILGPIAMGLAQAYTYTGDANHLAALSLSGGYLLTKINNFSPSDGYLAARLDQVFSGTTYTDHLIANFYGHLAAGTYDKNGAGTDYDTPGYITLIHDGRASIPNLAAWDIGMGLVAAASCGVSGTELDYWINGVKTEIDGLDGTDYYDVIGLAGAVYSLAFVGEDYTPTAGQHFGAANLLALADILVSYQIDVGGFAWNKDYVIPNNDNETVQETAYAMLALMTVDNAGYRSEILGAFSYLESVQLSTGGWENYPGNGENNEITGEGLWADAMVMQTGPSITIETPTAANCDEYSFDVTVADFNLIGSISMTLEYENAVLGYIDTDFHPDIAGLTSVNEINGIIYIGGFYPTAVTLADDAVLFTLTFNVKPAGWGATTTLHWPMLPDEANEIAGPNGQPVYIDSFFDVTYTFPEELAVTEAVIDADCPCSATGSIDLTVTGGTAPITYSWTGPGTFTSTNQNITGLVTGTYDVLVTDANGCTVNLSVFVNYTPDGTLPTITCPGNITVNNDPGVCEAVVDFMPATTRSIPPSPANSGASECQNMWQSFQVDVSGVLTGITVDNRTASTDWTYKLYAGIGIGGCELFSGFLAIVPSGLVTLPITNDTYLEAGLDYTYAISGICDGTACEICVDVWGTYASGAPVYANGYYWDNSHSVDPYCPSVPDDYHTNVICINTTFDILQLPAGMLLSDNCMVTNLTASPVSGSTFPVGTTPVTFTALDYTGNSLSCNFNIIVVDNELPVITCATPAALYNADPGVCDYTVTGYVPGFANPKIDNFWFASNGFMMEPGQSGGTWDDPDETGVWYQYFDPVNMLEWWNIWFYNEPLDLNRMKIIHMGFWIQPTGPNSVFNYVVNWSDDLWMGSGFPLPADEDHVKRSLVNSTIIGGLEWVEVYFEIPDYNPEWVSVDIWGDNILIEKFNMPPPAWASPALLTYWEPWMEGGIIVHECLPKAGANLDPIFFDDNCGGATVTNDYNNTSTLDGASFPVGSTPVTWTVTDGATPPNTDQCSYNIVVVDNQPPTITCAVPTNPYYVNTACTYVVPGTGLDPIATGDNCNVLSVVNDFNGTNTLAGAAFPVATTPVVWTITDVATPPNVTTCSYDVTVNKIAISGNLTYHNGGQTLGNVTLTLDDGVNPVLTTSTTPGTGAYGFSNLCAGNYTLSANFGAKAVGGINATDAAMANYWGIAPWSIEKVRFYAGDAVLNNLIDALDAQQILSYFVTAGGSAIAPPWKFWVAGESISANPVTPPVGLQIPTITIGGGDATINLLGQVSGDFNMSYSSATKSASETLILNQGKNIFAEVGTELDLPIVARIDMDLSAVSLILNFPADKLEISDVFLSSDPTSPLMYNVVGDELRIGWNSLIPTYLNVGESLITLKVKVIDEAGLEGINISLVADQLNELANGNYDVINDAVLVADVIHTSALGMFENNQADKLELANHPNPFNGTTNFVYTLPVDGKVILEIYDIIGNKVKLAVEEIQTAGEYTFILDANTLQPGVYTATLKLKNERTFITRSIKIISK